MPGHPLRAAGGGRISRQGVSPLPPPTAAPFFCKFIKSKQRPLSMGGEICVYVNSVRLFRPVWVWFVGFWFVFFFSFSSLVLAHGASPFYFGQMAGL